MKIYLLCLLLLTVVSCGKKSSDTPDLRPQRDEITGGEMEKEYLTLLNHYRESLGLVPLIYLSAVEIVAQEHSSYMVSGPGRFGHRGWRRRCEKLNVEQRSAKCGEIVGKGQKSPSDVLRSWVNSPSHRRILENPNFTHTGVGIKTNSKGVVYWTQIFLQKN